MRYALLCAFRNRKQKTLRFTEAVAAINSAANVKLTLFDDGSSDGTAELLKAQFPQVEIVTGDGSYYWNGAMSVLVDRALDTDADAVILANDDIELRPGAFEDALRLFEKLNDERPTAIVGAFHDGNGATTYSGFVRTPGRGPLNVRPVEPGAEPRPCETFNGNFVIIGARQARAVGGLDGRFLHAYGDIDLGYRLERTGTRLMVAPGYMGICRKGPGFAERLRSLGLRARMKVVLGPLRSPRDHVLFALKHGGFLAPVMILRDLIMRSRLIAIGR